MQIDCLISYSAWVLGSSNSTLMNMTVDVFVGLCYNAYKMLFKTCVCKNNYNTKINNRALQVLWYSQIPVIIWRSVISNEWC